MRFLKLFIFLIVFFKISADQNVAFSENTLRAIKAIVIGSDLETLVSRSFINSEGVILLGVEVPGKNKEFFKIIEDDFLNSSKKISELIEKITKYFHENGKEIKVLLPNQKFYGTIKLIIQEENNFNSKNASKISENSREKITDLKKEDIREDFNKPKEINSLEADKAKTPSSEELGSKENNSNEKIADASLIDLKSDLNEATKQKEEIKPEKIKAPISKIEEKAPLKMSLKNISAIIFLEDKKILESKSFVNAEGVLIVKAFIPGKKSEFVSRVEKFLNSNREFSDLEKEIKNYFHGNNYAVKIDFVAQKFNGGILKLVLSSQKEYFSVLRENSEMKEVSETLIPEEKVFEKKEERISEKTSSESLDKETLKSVVGLVLGNDERISSRSFINANGVILLDVEVPNTSKFVKKIEKDFLNSSKEISLLKKEIINYFYENDIEIKIIVPKQKLHGVLKLIIIKERELKKSKIDLSDKKEVPLDEKIADASLIDLKRDWNERRKKKEEIKPEKIKAPISKIEEKAPLKMSLKNVSAIIFLEDKKILESKSFVNAEGILIVKAFVPGKKSEFVNRIEKFLNSGREFSDLKNEIENYFHANNFTVKIDIPSQKFNDGHLKLVLVSKKESFLVLREKKEKFETPIADGNDLEKKEETTKDLPQIEEKITLKSKINPQSKIEEKAPLNLSLKNISAIIFLEDKKILESKSFVNAEGILIVKAFIPGKKNEFVNRIEKFLNSNREFSDLKNEIENYFQANNFTVKIDIPSQKFNDGLLKLVLISKKESFSVLKDDKEIKTLSQNLASDIKDFENKTKENVEKTGRAFREKNSQQFIKNEIFDDTSLKDVNVLVLAKDLKSINKRNFITGEGVVLLGVDSLNKKFLKEIESNFLGSSKDLRSLKEALIKYYFENEKEVTVEVLSQKAHTGVLKLIIKEKNNEKEKIVKTTQKATKKDEKIKKEIAQKDIFQNLQKAKKLSSIVITNEREEALILEKEVIIIPRETPNAKLLRQKLCGFLNKPMSKDLLLSIKHTIFNHYKGCKRPFVVVNIPEQNISEGKLKVVVFESTLGSVCVSGNKYFSKNQYKVSLKKGDFLNEEILIKDLNFINKNPFRNVEMIYKPGKENGTTDVELIAKEIRPVKIYYGAENTGLDLIGRNRFLVGAHFGNLFWSSQVFSYQLTRSFSSNAFEAHTMQYTIPLPWKHLLYFYGGFSKIHAQLPIFLTVKNKGSSDQASVRYEIPLKTLGYFTQNFTLGYDFKRTNNSAEFVEVAHYGQNVNLTQFYLGYEANIMLKGFMSSFNVDFYTSPYTWLENQTDKAYQTIRLYSKNEYVYSTIGLKNLISFYKDFALSVFFKCQFANANLLPSEEFGIGGYNTVRGYDERIASGDNGVLLSSEIRLPSFSIFQYWNKRVRDRLQFLGFVDYGKVYVERKVVGEPSNVHLLGIGPGLRYVIDPYLSLRIDYGIKMHRPHSIPNQKKRKLHFGLNVSF